jgi:hypothetical protein
MMRKTCKRIACKEVLEINDVVHRQDARPLIEIKSSSMMAGKWLFDTDAGLTCVSSKQFRLIPIEKRQFLELMPLGITYLSRKKASCFKKN